MGIIGGLMGRSGLLEEITTHLKKVTLGKNGSLFKEIVAY